MNLHKSYWNLPTVLSKYWLCTLVKKRFAIMIPDTQCQRICQPHLFTIFDNIAMKPWMWLWPWSQFKILLIFPILFIVLWLILWTRIRIKCTRAILAQPPVKNLGCIKIMSKLCAEVILMLSFYFQGSLQYRWWWPCSEGRSIWICNEIGGEEMARVEVTKCRAEAERVAKCEESKGWEESV